MKKILIIILNVCVLCSCSTKQHDQNVELIPLLTQVLDENIDNKDKIQLCMFISDNLCSACAEKEFMNIKSADIPVTLIGLYANKRNFNSSINQLKWSKVIFIQRVEKHSNVIPRIIYFIYNPKEKTCTEIFYPDPCDEELTFDYFKKIENSIAE
jgi:hypothetical protein